MLDSLPVKLLRKIERLSVEADATVSDIVERSISLYEQRSNKSLKIAGKHEDRLAELMRDPHKRMIYAEITEALGMRSSASMTPAELKLRAVKGGDARAKKLSPERRQAIASKAGKAAADKRAANKEKSDTNL